MMRWTDDDDHSPLAPTPACLAGNRPAYRPTSTAAGVRPSPVTPPALPAPLVADATTRHPLDDGADDIPPGSLMAVGQAWAAFGQSLERLARTACDPLLSHLPTSPPTERDADAATRHPLDDSTLAVRGLLWGLLLAVPLWLVILLMIAGVCYGYAVGAGWR